MLTIRLQRVGRTNDPNFRVVVVESKRGPRSGSFLEVLGSYNPRRERKVQLKEDRIRHWLSQGVQTSATVHNLLVDANIVIGRKRSVTPPLKIVQPSENVPVAEIPSETAGVDPAAREQQG